MNLFIFFHVEENGTKRRRPCHEPFGFACASRSRLEAPKLALLIAGLRQLPPLIGHDPDTRPRDKGDAPPISSNKP
jgi:hypothetical protein